MLSYSNRALSARPRFFAGYNDVTIIVEDTKSEIFYTKLFQCLLGDELRVGHVVGVGGKEEVIKRFDRLKDDILVTPEFYLVDGDFDELIDRPSPTHPLFYRLPRYDIENFLIDPEAICAVAEEQGPQHSAKYYSQRIDFNKWQNQLIGSICQLIACFALLHRLGMPPAGGRSNIERFVSGRKDIPDIAKMNAFIDSSRTSQSVLTEDEFDRHLVVILDRMGNGSPQCFRWMSGKNILLPLVIRMLKRETPGNITLDSLRFRLISHCQLAGLYELKGRILDTLNENIFICQAGKQMRQFTRRNSTQ